MMLQRLKDAHARNEFHAFVVDLVETGELFEVLPQMEGLNAVQQDPRWHPEGDVLTHTLLVVANLPPDATFAMSLAALFHDVGKLTETVLEADGRVTAHGHEDVSAEVADVMLALLGADDTLRQEVLFLVRHHMTAHAKQANAKTLRRLVREGGKQLVDDLLRLGVADAAGGGQRFEPCVRLRELFDNLGEVPTQQKMVRVLTGEQVMALTGLKPGPEVGKVLAALEKFCEGREVSQADAEQFVSDFCD